MNKRAATYRGSFSQARVPLSTRSRQRRPEKRCACGCGELRFCETHLARLHAIREELGEIGQLASVGNRRKQRQRAPVCCNPACFNVRVAGAAFCDACQAEGFTEEVA